LTAAALGLLLVAAPALAAQLPPRFQAAPASAGDQVDAYLRSRMTVQRIPGMQVAVVRGGRIVFLRSYGTASVELGVPMTDRTIL
jgi:CubicO group peptidase (beta-lactamase class C family)